MPVRVEVGPRDLANGEVTIVRRDTGEKRQVGIAGLASRPARDPRRHPGRHARGGHGRASDARTLTVSTIDEAREAAQTGFARIPWAALGEEGEALLPATPSPCAASRRPTAACPPAEDEPGTIAVVARAY